MKRISLFLYAIIALFAASCTTTIDGSGAISIKEFRVAKSANVIVLDRSMKLTLSSLVPAGKIEIRTYDNFHQLVEISNSDDVLELSIDNQYTISGSRIEVYASSEQYNGVEAGGGSAVILVGEVSSFSNYHISVSGGSTFTGGVVNAPSSVKIVASGGSFVALEGETAVCDLEAYGGSDISSRFFECDDLEVRLSGGSTAEMTVDNTIKGSLSGGSSINYYGFATDYTIKSEGSSVTQQ